MISVRTSYISKRELKDPVVGSHMLLALNIQKISTCFIYLMKPIAIVKWQLEKKMMIESDKC